MNTQATSPDLPETYYRDNFHCLVSTVADQYSDLLTAQETLWYNTYLALTEPAQCLYIRLLTRKGPLFRRDKIHYPEIKLLATAFEELDHVGLISLQPADISHSDFCQLFTKPELLSTFDFLSGSKQAKKAEIVEQVIQHHPDLTFYSSEILKVHYAEHLSVFCLLFFGNTHQDLSQFVLADIGIQQFEHYPIDTAFRLFQHREHIDNWLALSEKADIYWQHKEAKETQAIAEMQSDLPGAFDWKPLERKRQRLINHIARDLERLGNHDSNRLDQALTLFQQSERAPSRERQIRILDKQGETKQALDLVKRVLTTPQNEEEADVADVLNHRLLNKLGDKQPPRRKPKFDSEKLKLIQQQLCVELDVAAYYQQQGWQAYYLENTLFCGLFGLAMWDIIFSAQQGAFLNPFQRSPKDMFSSDFYLKRKQLIDKRLNDLESGEWDNWLAVYNAKQGLSNDWVHWGVFTEEILIKAVSAIPVLALTAIFKRILFDPRNNRSGFPDLALFKDGQYCLAEVKGPGDTLQNNQIRWLKMFEQHSIAAKVVYVEWC
ncbi:VRR-NUC domain-containing protein [Photobacterium rosenbergii]|uniref:phosphodiesterase I n=1 Tax=Photobacterium rosenbergii TaxID=294936 RepID=A0A2T3NH52_9GAMM|nr:VRR-NUC domain-containing protein [Photobacterium rosenbergii]PSW14352.1 VRR-NUC domain-containing protein [Photobacterium rosenbergii]